MSPWVFQINVTWKLELGTTISSGTQIKKCISIVLVFAHQGLSRRYFYCTAKQLHKIINSLRWTGSHFMVGFFFSQTKCRILVKIRNTDSLRSIISSLERSFTAS